MNEATRTFVRQHADDDVRMLALRGVKDPEVELSLALQQIQGRQKARQKLPSWTACEGLLYPAHLSMEQCSSEQTARYKAAICGSVVARCSSAVCCDSVATDETRGPMDAPARAVKGAKGAFFVDLTGGFGVDFSFLAPLFTEAVYVERQEELCQIAHHNFEALGLKNTTIVCGDGTDYLRLLDRKATLIFLDPARRDEHGGRTYGIADCTPDVLQLRDELLQKGDCVLLKLSPMLDWRKTVEDLGRDCVREVHIVSAGGECKELLLLLSRQTPASPLKVVCVNDDEVFEFTPEQDNTNLLPLPSHLIPQTTFLYEPNASIMKAGCFAELSVRFGVAPLAQNSHLFVSAERVGEFPGRAFSVEAVSTMNKRELKEKVLPLKQANITVRNFPLSVAELRKRLKLSEGGSAYLFATTLADGNHVLIVCQRL